MVASTSSGVIHAGVPAGTMQLASSRFWQSDCRLLRDMGDQNFREKKRDWMDNGRFWDSALFRGQ